MSSDNDDLAKHDDRKTRELCGTEKDGLRCMRSKGHDHRHEAFTADGAIRWEE